MKKWGKKLLSENEKKWSVNCFSKKMLRNTKNTIVNILFICKKGKTPFFHFQVTEKIIKNILFIKHVISMKQACKTKKEKKKLLVSFHFKAKKTVKNQDKKLKKVSNLEMEEPDLFELETDIEELKRILPISLFKEIESEVNQQLLNNREDLTDGPIAFIENLYNIIQSKFDELLGDNNDKKVFLRSLTQIFTILLSVRADSTDKIKQIVKIAINEVLKTGSGQN